jgi:hypothetical protein
VLDKNVFSNLLSDSVDDIDPVMIVWYESTQSMIRSLQLIIPVITGHYCSYVIVWSYFAWSVFVRTIFLVVFLHITCVIDVWRTLYTLYSHGLRTSTSFRETLFVHMYQWSGVFCQYFHAYRCMICTYYIQIHIGACI